MSGISINRNQAGGIPLNKKEKNAVEKYRLYPPNLEKIWSLKYLR